MYPARMPRSKGYGDILSLRSFPYSSLHLTWSVFHSSGSNFFQDAVTSGMPYPLTMSKNICLCSRLGLSSSSLSQLQNTKAISTSSSPRSFPSITALRRLRDPGPLPVENHPSLSMSRLSV